MAPKKRAAKGDGMMLLPLFLVDSDFFLFDFLILPGDGFTIRSPEMLAQEIIAELQKRFDNHNHALAAASGSSDFVVRIEEIIEDKSLSGPHHEALNQWRTRLLMTDIMHKWTSLEGTLKEWDDGKDKGKAKSGVKRRLQTFLAEEGAHDLAVLTLPWRKKLGFSVDESEEEGREGEGEDDQEDKGEDEVESDDDESFTFQSSFSDGTVARPTKKPR